MEIVLVRHGETAWNREEIFRGRQDVPLNETGLKQAELLSCYLSGKRVAAVFSSPLIRAVRTAGVIAVSHRVTLKVLICGLLGLDDSHFFGVRIDNGAVTTFSCEGERYILVSHNETSFLGALGESRLRDF